MALLLIDDDPAETGEVYDPECGVVAEFFDRAPLFSLALNLAIVAVACEAFERGKRYDLGALTWKTSWSPGCGWAMSSPRQPAIFPCGCSKHKVNLGKCDSYIAGSVP